MSRLDFLVDKSNGFSKADINDVSQHLFSSISIDFNKIDGSFGHRYEVLDLLINTLTKILYANLIDVKEDKVKLVLMINQLKLQKELFELMRHTDFDKKQLKLTTIAERFGQKSQSAVVIPQD